MVSPEKMRNSEPPEPYGWSMMASVGLLQALVPKTIEVEVPFELHRYIIGQKGSGIRRMMEEFEVSEQISTSSQLNVA